MLFCHFSYNNFKICFWWQRIQVVCHVIWHNCLLIIYYVFLQEASPFSSLSRCPSHIVHPLIITFLYNCQHIGLKHVLFNLWGSKWKQKIDSGKFMIQIMFLGENLGNKVFFKGVDLISVAIFAECFSKEGVRKHQNIVLLKIWKYSPWNGVSRYTWESEII